MKVSLLNFAITFSGLEDQLLGVCVIEERPDMEEKKSSLVIANARMKVTHWLSLALTGSDRL